MVENGIFNKKDSEAIQQSVKKKDRDWLFLRALILEKIEQKQGPIVISDVGCGTGANAILCMKQDEEISQYVSKFYCIDGSKEMLENIEKENIPKVESICMDLETNEPLKLPKSDLIISKYMFHHIKNKKQLLEYLRRSLHHDGIIAVIDKFPRFSLISSFFEKLWHILGIKRVLGKHFYSTVPEFTRIIQKAGLGIASEDIKPGKRMKNFFIFRGYFVLERNFEEKSL
jgi:SAM-dependent methyltransferase